PLLGRRSLSNRPDPDGGRRRVPVRVSVLVRPATLDDLDAAVDLFAAVAEEGRWIGGEAPVDKIERRARFESSIHRDDAQFFVADDDGRIVGELGIEVAGYGVADFGRMVGAEVRRHGVGSAVLVGGVEWA